jgi:acetyl-CoA C-acetyltransferase
LGATAIKTVVNRSGIKPEDVSSVVMGNVVQAGNRMNPARQAAINGGIPLSVPAQTVNRVCCSGAQALLAGEQEIAFGASEVQSRSQPAETGSVRPALLINAFWFSTPDPHLHRARENYP